MTIFEQLLAGLQQKFSGADTATLTRIATKKAEGVTDETKVNSIVEGISFQDVMQNYGDYRAGQANISSVANYEKKYGLKDGKPIEGSQQQQQQQQGSGEGEKPDIAKMIADGISAGIKPFADKLAAFEAKEAQAQRNAQVASVAKKYGIPDFMLKDRNIPDDADLDNYFKELKQDMVNNGYKESKAPETAEQRVEKENHDIAAMINKGTEAINNNANK